MSDQTPPDKSPDGAPAAPAPPPADPPPAADSSPPTTQTGDPPVDWEARFKGMQSAYSKLEQKNTDAQGTLSEAQAELEKLTVEGKTSESKLKELEESIVDLTTEKETLTSEADISKLQADRAKLIMAEYPELSEFFGNDLIRTVEDIEEQTKIFDTFKKIIDVRVQSTLTDIVSGSGPSTTGDQDTPTLDKDNIYDRMTALAGSRDPKEMEEYAELEKQWKEQFQT